MDVICLEPGPSNGGRGLVAMGAVRPLLVVELPPAFDQDLGLGTAAEPLPVQQLVPQLAVEAFDEPVLPGAARRDEGRTNRRVSQPAHDLRGWELHLGRFRSCKIARELNVCAAPGAN